MRVPHLGSGLTQCRWLLWLVWLSPWSQGAEPAIPVGTPVTADVVVYGGTAAAVTAAVQVKKMGKSVVIVSPDKHLGGLSSGGLGFTDTGNKAVIGGLAREFYHRVWKHYSQPAGWVWQKQSEYGNKGQGTPAIDGAQRTMWIFEPHVAERVFEDLVAEHAIPVHRDEWLDRRPREGAAGGEADQTQSVRGVDLQAGRIVAVRTLSGREFRGRVFLDATYEGDLMAGARVSYHVGRESQQTYGEHWNGVQVGVLHHRHHFGAVAEKISPYWTPGDPSSGLLPRISADPPGEYGAGDRRVQAYCYRMCLTKHAENRVPFPKPEGYDPRQYELVLRVLKAGWRETFEKFDPIPNLKTDTNNHGPFSTDNIGMNYDYPEATYERRREILREHMTYQQGLMFFLANDPRVPDDVRQAVAEWGLARDEFVDNGHWPHQIYVREARRLVGRYVMTENELLKRRPTPESVGMGSYTIDSHNVQRYVTPDGFVQNEGDIGVPTRGPYQIAFGSLLPKAEECSNLLVPICVSSSHIAFGSIRMEPVFMILGQSAATAAVMAVERDIAVQAVPYADLRQRLLADGQVLEHGDAEAGAAVHSVDEASLGGVIVDDERAERTGEWHPSTAAAKWVGMHYQHERNVQDGSCSARFVPRLPESGRYEVRVAYPPNRNRSSRVLVEIHHAGGVTEKTLNQREVPTMDGLFTSLGEFEFTVDGETSVTISNRSADGYVVIDAVQWLPVEKKP